MKLIELCINTDDQFEFPIEGEIIRINRIDIFLATTTILDISLNGPLFNKDGSPDGRFGHICVSMSDSDWYWQQVPIEIREAVSRCIKKHKNDA